MPPSDYSVLENVQAITEQNYVVHVKVLKQCNIAHAVNIKDVRP